MSKFDILNSVPVHVTICALQIIPLFVTPNKSECAEMIVRVSRNNFPTFQITFEDACNLYDLLTDICQNANDCEVFRGFLESHA